MNYDPIRPPPRAEATWEPWRSRDIRWVKLFRNGQQQDCYRDKQGNVYPAEAFKRTYERLEGEQDKGEGL